MGRFSSACALASADSKQKQSAHVLDDDDVSCATVNTMAPQETDRNRDDALSAEDALRVTYPSEPTLRNLTSEAWGKPAPKSNPALQ